MPPKKRDSASANAGATSGSDSAAEARERADELRASLAGRLDILAGSIIGGDIENWAYYHIPDTEPTKTRAEAKLRSNGWEPCPRETSMAGIFGGRVWRLPRIIAVENLARRKERLANRKF